MESSDNLDNSPLPKKDLDESLSEVPPVPVLEEIKPSLEDVGVGASVIVGAGIGAFLLVSGTMTPCMGATRSARLKWEERQLQIEQAERHDNSAHTERL